VQPVTREDLEAYWTGRVVLCKRPIPPERRKAPVRPGLVHAGDPAQRPLFPRHRHRRHDVEYLSLVTPVMFNVMIDKVVPHHSYNTLVTVTSSSRHQPVRQRLSYIRQYLMQFATNKIRCPPGAADLRASVEPAPAFLEVRSAGVLLRHLQQAESIRGFLTGRILPRRSNCRPLPVLLVVLSLYSAR